MTSHLCGAMLCHTTLAHKSGLISLQPGAMDSWHQWRGFGYIILRCAAKLRLGIFCTSAYIYHAPGGGQAHKPCTCCSRLQLNCATILYGGCRQATYWIPALRDCRLAGKFCMAAIIPMGCYPATGRFLSRQMILPGHSLTSYLPWRGTAALLCARPSARCQNAQTMDILQSGGSTA